MRQEFLSGQNDDKPYLFCDDLTVNMWRFNDICRPPSSVSSRLTREASKASRSSSVTSLVEPPEGVKVGLVNGSMFHRRMVASCDPDAKTRVSPSF